MKSLPKSDLSSVVRSNPGSFSRRGKLARRRFSIARRVAFSMAALLGGSLGTQAATLTKNATAGALNTGTSYVEGTVPGATDVVLFNNTVTAAQTDTLGGSFTLGQIQVLNPGGAITINDAAAGNVLTLAGIVNAAGQNVGIDLSAATQNLTIGANSAITLGASQVWLVGAGRTLSVASPIGETTAGTGLTFSGTGALTLTGTAAGTATTNANNTYSGATTINGGTLNLNSAVVNQFNIISSASTLVMGGGTVSIVAGANVGTTTQNFNGLTLNAGAATLSQGRGANSKVVVNLGAVARNTGAAGIGGTVNFFPTSNSSLFSTTTASTNGIIGGWATLNSTDFARGATTAGTVTTIAAATYTADAWAAANNTNVTLANNTIPDSSTTNSLRFAAVASDTVTLSGINTIASGGILVSSAVTAGNNDVITGGTLMGAPGADLVVNQYGAGTLAINSVIADNAGATALTKTGTGLLTLGAVNTFTGGIFLNQGTLQVGITGALNGNVVNFTNNSSAVLSLAGNNAFVGGLNTTSVVAATAPIVQNASATNATLTINTAGTATFAGNIQNGTGAGTLGLTKTGAGTQTLTGVSTYTGPTNVTGGTLAVRNTIASSSAINVGAGATLDASAVTGGLSIASGKSLGGSGTVLGAATIGAGASLTPGTVGTVGTLTLSALTLSATTSTLNFDLNSGSSDLVSVTGANALTINGGQFNLAGTATAASGSVFNLFSYAGAIQGTGVSSLTVASGGAGGLTYTFSDDTVNHFVKLTISGTAAQSSTWNTNANSSWGVASNWNPAVVPQNLGDTATFGAVITAPRTVTLDGNRSLGVLNFNSANAYTIAQGTGGTLSFNNGSGAANVTDSLGSHVISAPTALVSNTQMTVTNAADSLTLSGAVSGAGALTKSGAGTLFLTNGTNSYTGGTAINAGTLNFVPGSLGAATGGVTFGGGTLQYAAGNTEDISTRTVTLAGQAVIDTGANTVSYVNPIGNGGAGGVTKLGSGTLVLPAGNTFTGANTITAGTLNISGDTALGAVPATVGTNLTFNAPTGSTATLQAQAALTVAANRGVVLASGTAAIDTNTFNVTVAGPLSGTGLLSKVGDGALTLSNTTNSTNATGGITVNAGNVTVPTTAALPTGTLTLNGTGTVTATQATTFNAVVNGTNTITETASVILGVGNITGPSTATLTVVDPFVIDVTGNLTGFNGTLIAGGTSGFRLNGTTGSSATTFDIRNTGISVRNTATAIALGGLMGTGVLTGSAGGATQAVTYTVGGNNLNTTFGGTITNGASTTTIVKAGTGTTTLTNAGSTYTGTTTVNGGTLEVANDGGATTAGVLSTTSSFTLNTGGTLLLSGSTGVTDRLNGAAPVILGGGTLNLNTQSEGAIGTTGVGVMTLTATSAINFGLAGNANVIQFASIGAHTVGAVLNIINWEGTSGAPGTDKLLFAGVSTDFATQFPTVTDVTFNGTPGYATQDFGTYYEVYALSAVPEPSTTALAGGVAALAFGWSQRRRLRGFKVGARKQMAA